MIDHQTITATLRQHALAHPNRVAVVCDGHAITWRELNQAVDRLAAHLSDIVPVGRGVGLHLPNCPALVLLFLAAARAGREAQILDPSWPIEATRLAIKALSPGLLVSEDSALAAGGSAPTVIGSHEPFAVIADAIGAKTSFQSVPEPDPLSPFYVGFTSGSTGLPKGYRRHHLSWVESFRAGDREFDIDARDVVLAPGALTHSLFLYGLAHGLYAGATVILCRQFRPNLICRLIETHNASILYGVPTQLEMIVDSAVRERSAPFATMRWILSSGAKWQGRAADALREQFPVARFSEFYGASELSFITVAKDDEDVPQGSVGRAFAGVDLSIRDHRGRRLPPGDVGQVFVASPFVFIDYACGDATALLRDGDAISVGDVGVLDQGGYLRLVGRASRMIITSGKNVHPEEIERVLEGHPAVAAASVLGVDDDRRGERLLALLKLHAQVSVTASDIIAYARSYLPLYKIPRQFVLPQQWPLTSSGKNDFEALRRMWECQSYEALS